MKRSLISIFALLACFRAAAQAPHIAPDAGCRDALLVAAERYELRGARGGHGESLDWIGCSRRGTVFTAGVGDYSIADNRWWIARGGLSARPRDDVWFSASAAAGAGRDPSGSFDYLSTREGVTARPVERLFVRFEHQLIRIAQERGSVFTVAAIVQPVRALLIELGVSRSAGGNLGTRSQSVRVDWVRDGARLFAGAALGRTTPQVVDIVSGGALDDARSRQGFVGAAIAIGVGEAVVAYDEIRKEGSSRRTVSLSVRWPLP